MTAQQETIVKISLPEFVEKKSALVFVRYSLPNEKGEKEITAIRATGDGLTGLFLKKEYTEKELKSAIEKAEKLQSDLFTLAGLNIGSVAFWKSTKAISNCFTFTPKGKEKQNGLTALLTSYSGGDLIVFDGYDKTIIPIETIKKVIALGQLQTVNLFERPESGKGRKASTPDEIENEDMDTL